MKRNGRHTKHKASNRWVETNNSQISTQGRSEITPHNVYIHKKEWWCDVVEKKEDHIQQYKITTILPHRK